MNEIYYATGNTSKFNEVKDVFNQFCPSITLKQCAIDILEPQMLDQREVAIYKARQAFKEIQKPLLVDDAGMFFKSYPLFPGVLTKPIIKAIGWDGILRFAQDDTSVFHAMHLVYIENDTTMQVFYVECPGKLIRPASLDAPKGLRGYAYFVPEGSDKTYAQMYGTPEMEKFSYRLNVLKQFAQWYENDRK